MSKRQDRKLKRGAGLSRPNRRGAERLASATAGYVIACKVSKNAAGFTKPGAFNKW